MNKASRRWYAAVRWRIEFVVGAVAGAVAGWIFRAWWGHTMSEGQQIFTFVCLVLVTATNLFVGWRAWRTP